MRFPSKKKPGSGCNPAEKLSDPYNVSPYLYACFLGYLLLYTPFKQSVTARASSFLKKFQLWVLLPAYPLTTRE